MSAFDPQNLGKRKSAGAASKGEPTAAVLLTLFVPGLGHLYLGRVGLGLLAFALIEGVYLAGYFLSEGLAFSFLDPELRGRMAVALSPEVGNLGGLVWHFSTAGFGPTEPVPWPPWIRLGYLLTSLSGLLNACLMVHVHLLARRDPALEARGGLGRPAFQVFLAWLFPGLGHWAQGRKLRGAIVAGLLVGLFVLGCVLCEWTNLSRERHFYYWAGQFLLGLPAMGAELLGFDRPVADAIPYVDAGLLFGCVAGLLNVLAMLDVYAQAEADLLEAPAASQEPSTQSPEQQSPAEPPVAVGEPAPAEEGATS